MSNSKEIIRIQYEGIEEFFTNDGWLNATKAGQRYNKRPVDWLALTSTQEYISALAELLKCQKSSLLKTRRGNTGGTYLHPDLVVCFGRWLDVRFSIWCDIQAKNLLSGTHVYFDWKKLRHESRSTNKVQNEAIKIFREEQGKLAQTHHFSNEARLINWVMNGKFGPLDRDTLSMEDLDLLAKLEIRNAVLISRNVTYPDRKKILEQYAIDLRSPPILTIPAVTPCALTPDASDPRQGDTH